MIFWIILQQILEIILSLAVINYLVSVIGIDKVPEKVVEKTKKGGVQSDATCKNKEK